MFDYSRLPDRVRNTPLDVGLAEMWYLWTDEDWKILRGLRISKIRHWSMRFEILASEANDARIMQALVHCRAKGPLAKLVELELRG